MSSQLFQLADIQALLAKYESEGYKPFDEQAYIAAYLTGHPEEPVFSSALEHFLEVGAAAGYNPLGDAPLQFFDASFYAAKYPKLAEVGVLRPWDLFGHYLLFGVGEGREASEVTNNFDSARYLHDYPQVAQYVNSHLDDFFGNASNGALAHFMKFGADQGFVGFRADPPTNDRYSLDHLFSGQYTLKLTDNPADDRDTVVVANFWTVISFNGMDGYTISLEKINDAFGMDFDVLDLSLLSAEDLFWEEGDVGLVIMGDNSLLRDTSDTLLSAEADDLILGDPYLISTVNGLFQDLLLTDTTIKHAGTSYVLDTVKQGKFMNGDGEILFSVNVFTGGLDASLVTQGVTLRSLSQFSSIWLVGSNYNDTLTGGEESNLIRGGAGRDVMDGGGGNNVFVFNALDSSLEQAAADVVNNFAIGQNTIEFFNPNGKFFSGVAAGLGINYVEAVASDLPTAGGKVGNFTEALTAANKALAALNANISASTGSLVSFQYDATNGYVFQDVDGNGTADQVVILTGIDSGEFSHTNLTGL
jgi:hypothetical protein